MFFHGRKELVIDLFWRPRPCPLEKEFLSHEEIFPLKTYRFHDVEITGPGNPESYLRRCYGNSYLTHCKVWTHDWNNQCKAGFDPNKEIIPVEEYLAFCQAQGFFQVRLADFDKIVGTGAKKTEAEKETEEEKEAERTGAEVGLVERPQELERERVDTM